MNILALSTLVHLYAIIPFILYGGIYDPLYSLYCFLILTSTIVSAQWHTYNEPFGSLSLVDYIMTVVRFAMDIYLSYTCCGQDAQMLVIKLHFLILHLNMFIGSPTTEHYILRHSAWHIASAAKAVFVSYMIATNMIL